jgi:hypothetical protein
MKTQKRERPTTTVPQAEPRRQGSDYTESEEDGGEPAVARRYHACQAECGEDEAVHDEQHADANENAPGHRSTLHQADFPPFAGPFNALPVIGRPRSGPLNGFLRRAR